MSVRAAVIGFPIKHSLSPVIFKYLAEQNQKEISYRRISVKKSKLENFVANSRKEFVGCNVTIPHKETVLDCADNLSNAARTISAVNVLQITKRGKVVGHNTDYIGVLLTLREHKVSVRNKNALIYGTGGSARAAAYALKILRPKKVFVVSRDLEKAKIFCKSFGSEFLPALNPKQIDDSFSLLINATPAGLPGVKARLQFPKKFSPGCFAFDFVYNYRTTPFTRKSKRHGLRTTQGLDMLIWQAFATWEIWFGPLQRKRELKLQLKKKLLHEL